MRNFSSQIKFVHPWRDYQLRVLEDLESHLADDHLHVIAPPGSGKTVLGLEVMLRLDQPTLILAPTLAIRNQWIHRFCELFLGQTEEPEWISRDIRNPKLVTVVTYQGLHAACHSRKEDLIRIDYEDDTDLVERKRSNFLNLNEIVQGLKRAKIQTIIVDEAHHLKNEWWQTLSRIKNAVHVKIVGLTATPPYDVSAAEWMRYVDLNGPVDAEISVPELVKSGDLCPHQDYLYLSEVDADVKQEIDDFRVASQIVYDQLLADTVLTEAISSHPIWLKPLDHESFIYENLIFYSASLIYLHAKSIPITAEHMSLLGLERLDDSVEIPILDKEWMQVLLSFYLFEEDGFFAEHYAEHRDKWLNRLRRIGVLERKTLRFDHSAAIAQHLSSSITKLDAIAAIVEFEYEQLKSDLRQVILTDYIRKEFLSKGEVNEIALTKIGVVSIFEKLRRNNKGKKIGLLTGSLVVVPRDSVEQLQLFAQQQGVPILSCRSLSYDDSYVELAVNKKNTGYLVHLVTQLFEQGGIEVLIGTKSLLGEGWDAPAINSLILASFVGSFVLSNQMRGRAIRTQKNKPDKTSNIWHIAAIDPTEKGGGTDLAMMRRRFRNFVSVSEYEEVTIENGLDRLCLPTVFESKVIQEYNRYVLTRAGERKRLASRWKDAISKGAQLVEEIKIPLFDERTYIQAKVAHTRKYIGNMVAGLSSSVLFFIETSTQAFSRLVKYMPGQPVTYGMLAMFGVGVLFYGNRAIKTLDYYRRYRDISKDIYKIGRALVSTLCKAKLFTTPLDQLKVLTYGDDKGSVFCHLDGGTSFERSSFIQMMQEIVDPIDNPRYIIVRKSKLLKFIRQQDFHAVPELLAKKAALAKDFHLFWQQEVGSSSLYFTKSVTGRKILLRSKIFSLANNFAEEWQIKPINIWR